MSLLKQFYGRTQPPASEQPTDTDMRSQLFDLVHMQVKRLPYTPQISLFWRDLNEMRSSWWLLLPLLAWIGWRTYQAERRELCRQKTPDNVRKRK